MITLSFCSLLNTAAWSDIYTDSYHLIIFSPAGKVSNVDAHDGLRASPVNQDNALAIHCDQPTQSDKTIHCMKPGTVSFVFTSNTRVACEITISSKNGIHDPVIESANCDYKLSLKNNNDPLNLRGFSHISELAITESRFVKETDITGY